MESDWNVDVVGREFVRQYYTILNQRPDCLHQFFTEDSSYVHGGIEKAGEERPAYYGQSVIHDRIVSMNFCDARTKIRQVDCQRSVNDSVLVQVSGEFSTNGLPMRRFMQSFVLVQKTPKNFYVHNDIFRYQDEVFHDFMDGFDDGINYEEEYVIIRDERPEVVNVEMKSSTAVDATSKDVHVLEDRVNNAPTGYLGASMDLTGQQDYPTPPIAAVVANQTKLDHAINQLSEHLDGQQQLNGHVDLASPTNDETSMTAVVEQMIKSEHATPLEVPTSAPTPATPVEAVEVKVDDEKPTKSSSNQTQSLQPQPPQQQPQPLAAPKVFSWASLASKNTTPSPNLATPLQKPQATIKPERKTETAVTPHQHAVANGINGGSRQHQQAQNKYAQPGDKKWSESTPPSSISPSTNNDDSTSGGKAAAPPFIPDNQQLFIGNLPHTITEQEIKELFEKFGSVIDIKINRKGATRDLPNFGFVAFDSHDAVTKAMKAKPIMLHGKRRINIEEKKDQSGGGGGGVRRPPMRGKGAAVMNKPSGGGSSGGNNSSGGGGGATGRVGSGGGPNSNLLDEDH